MSTISPQLLSGLLAEARTHMAAIRTQLDRINGQPDVKAMQVICDEVGVLSDAAAVLELDAIVDMLSPVRIALGDAGKDGWPLTDETRTLIEEALPGVDEILSDAVGETTPEQDTPVGATHESPPVVAYPELPAELAEIFTQEALDHIRTIQIGMESLRKSPADGALLADLRRATHTLKGAAGSVGYDAIARVAHQMEDLFEHHMETATAVPDPAVSVLLDTTDLLELLLDPARSAETPALLNNVLARYRALLPTGSDEAASAEPQMVVSADAMPAPQVPANTLRLPIENIDLLINRVGEIVINRSSFERHLISMRGLLSEMDDSTKRLNRLAVDINNQIESAPWGQPGTLQRADSLFDPIELDHYTVLHQYARELEEATTDTADINAKLRFLADDFDGSLIRERRLTNELQSGLMSARLVSFHEIETRLHQIVRRTAQALSKRVELTLAGFETQVDKQVLETLLDPLTHLLRNAIDHGIESVEERSAAGKPATGQITVSVVREHGRVTISMSDDGSGIDIDRVQKRAAVSGLIDPADRPTTDAVIDLLFVDGFSAAETVTQTSGRGVGLSIVKRAVNRLQGLIRVETRPGGGTTFVLSVPVTLAITRALYVESGDQVFAVPLEQISGVIQMTDDTLKESRELGVVHDNNRAWGVFDLSEFVQGPPAPPRYGLLVEAHSSEQVVMVTRLAGIHETVVKQLGAHLRRVHGVAGATISGDGRVILILDLHELIGADKREIEALSEPPPPAEKRSMNGLHVLVVDDSPSVRRVVSSFLERQGWKATPAKDGIDALDKLAHIHPDVALVDIEMPRMNGFDLLSRIKSDPALSHIPVVFLTSRSASKHRQRAAQLNVDGYLVKPYKEEQLISELKRVTQAVVA